MSKSPKKGTFGTGGKAWTDKFDAITLQSMHRETVKKEMKNFTIKEEFTTHPKSITLVTDKPNKRGKKFLDKDEALLQSIISTLSPEQIRKYEEKTGDLTLTTALQSTISQEEEEAVKSINDNEFLKTLSALEKTPTEKYNKPQTSSQEVGWFNQYDSTNRDSLYNRPKKSCEETLFARQLIKFKQNIRDTSGNGVKPNASSNAAKKK